MDRVYRVTGTVIKGHVRDYEIILIADNIKDAKATALGEWAAMGGEDIGHLFHLNAHRTGIGITRSNSMWHKTGELIDGHWVSYV